MDLLVMSGDVVVAKWINNELIIINDSLLPLQLKRHSDVSKWLETRAIDCHRANSRLLKKALRLSEKDDFSTAVSVNGVTITDNYWVKPIDSTLTYDDVKFSDDYFAGLALNGNYDSFNKAASSKRSRTPELTNTGSFEKCWRLIDGKWWMYKRANHDEMFSEMFIYLLGKKLRFNMAEYKRGRGYIKTLDFTDNGAVNFEPAHSFMGDNEDYVENLKAINKLNPACVKPYIEMLFLDTICANPDRHTFNYGVIRDERSGKIIGLAPNFDNNMALIARGYPKNLDRKNDMLVRLFNKLLEYDKSIKKFIPDLTEKILKEVLEELNMKVKSKEIITFIMNGYKQIMK